MTHDSPHRNRTSRGEFLLETTHRATDRLNADSVMAAIRRRLNTGHPNLCMAGDCRQMLTDAAADWTQLTAVAIEYRIDQTPDAHGAAMLCDAIARLADRLSPLTAAAEGHWGLLTANLLLAVVPMALDDARSDIATPLMTRMAEPPRLDISIGMASYPQLDFTITETVANAIKAVDHARFLPPNAIVPLDAISLNISGDLAYDAGDMAGAIAEYDVALQLDPANANVLNSLGVCHGQLGNREQALDAFKQATTADSDDAMAMFNLGQIEALIGSSEDARNAWTAAVTKDPTLFEAQVQLGRWWMEHTDAARALAHLETAEQLRPGVGVVQHILGDCLLALDRVAEATAICRSAVKRNANDAEALSLLGTCLDRNGEDPEIALVFAKQSIDIEPDNGRFHHRMGMICYNQGRFNAALDAFRDAERLGTDATGMIAAAEHQLIVKTA